MSTETKYRVNAIAHFVWAALAIVYFIIAVLLARQGKLQPDTLKDTLSESVGYAISLVIFIVFYAVGIGIGVIEAIVHGILQLTRPVVTDGAIWLYIVLFIKASVLADCTFLSYVMGTALLPEARGEALFFILPLVLLGVLQIGVFCLDLWIKKDKENLTRNEAVATVSPSDSV